MTDTIPAADDYTLPAAPDHALPPTLLAIARAARIIGDHDLERTAVRELRERYGIAITFTGPQTCGAPAGEAARGT